jgi:alkylation response protein AidB-like acyl-CoA dehydrogenase
MTIAVTGDQTDLAEAVAGFTARHADVSATRAAFDKIASGEPQSSWQALVEQRLHAIHLPEWAGGDGAGLVELAVVLEETAFGLLPGPLLPTVLASQLITAHAPQALASRLLPALAGGATAASAVTATGLRATRVTGGWRVSGETAPVLGAASARVLVLGAVGETSAVKETGAEAPGSASEGGALWMVLDGALLGDAVIIAAEPVDLTRDIATVRLDGLLIPDAQLLTARTDQVRDVAATLFAAESAGVARWCQQTGLAYAKVREQFGATIGSFQAIKHKCARLFARTELLTAAAWDAAVASQQDEGQFALAAASAAVLAPQAAIDIALDTVTLLGGIGYTWEHDAHLYWRRAMSLAAILGPKGTWQRRLTELSRVTERRHDLRLEDEPAGLRDWVAAALAEAARVEDPAGRRRFLADRGLAAPHYPRPYGIDATPAAQVVIAQEFERAGLNQPSTIVGEWALPTILAHGTPEQRESFVAATLRGDITWCQLFSEPGAGSDLASLRTRACKADGGWVITGQKVWTSSAAEADWAICLARTDPEAPKHKGISYFLVDMRGPGIDVRPLREANGGYLFNEVFLADVFVPDARLVGGPGDGWRLARTTLGNERVNIANGSVSQGGHRPRLPSRFLDELPGPVPDEVLAEAGALTAEALAFAAMSQRLLLRRIAGLRPGAEASVLKVVSAANVAGLRRAVLDWNGASAAALSSPSRDYLSVPPQLIGGGTVEIQLNVIGERVLGLPR